MKYFFFILLIFFSCSDLIESNPLRATWIYKGKYKDLMAAAQDDNLAKMEKIAKTNNLDLNFADSFYGVSLLNWCIFNQKEKPFEKLLELGANPNWEDSAGKFAAPIIEGAKVETPKYLELCLSHGGNVNFLSTNGVDGSGSQTPLLASMFSIDYFENVKFLVNHGADVNLIPANYWSPLTEALSSHQIEIVQFLIAHGADYNKVDFWTQTVALDSNDQPIRDDNGNLVMRKNKELHTLDYLRFMTFPLDSKQYKMKMEVVSFLKTKGLDYWKTSVPPGVIDQYKNDPDYLSKY